MAQELYRAKTMGDAPGGFWQGLHTKFPRRYPRAPSPCFQASPSQRTFSSLKFGGLIEALMTTVKRVIVVILVTLTGCLLVPVVPSTPTQPHKG